MIKNNATNPMTELSNRAQHLKSESASLLAIKLSAVPPIIAQIMKCGIIPTKDKLKSRSVTPVTPPM